MESAGIAIEIRDTLRDPGARAELLSGGGSATVPCLRIARGDDVHWLYESADIIDYLSNHYGV
jgi:glutathione S-transferase